MTTQELNEIRQLPEKYRPLSAWGYFWLTFLYSIPIIGFIFLLIHAINSENINRRSFARSYFCVLVILLFVLLIVAITGGLGAIAGLLTK